MKWTVAQPGFLSVGGGGIVRVIHHTLSMINIYQISPLVGWWKQQGGRNSCNSVPKRVKNRNNSTYRELKYMQIHSSVILYLFI
jgi:hypothetical protein